MEMATDVLILQARAQKQSCGVNGTASHHDLLAPHQHAVPFFRPGLDAGGATTLDADFFCARLNDKFGAVLLGVGQPCLGGGLLGADGATVAAIAADFPLFAADDV